MALLRESERGEVGVHASHLHLQACGNGRSGGFRCEGVAELAAEEERWGGGDCGCDEQQNGEKKCSSDLVGEAQKP